MGYGHESGRQDQNRNSSVVIGDGVNLDGFSRLRTSNPTTLFDSSFEYDLDPLIYETSTANGGGVVHSATRAAAALTLDGSAGGSAIIQSKRYIRYIPGKSQLVLMTGLVGTAVASAVKRMGYFDANNGIFLEQNGTTDVAFVLRTNTSGSPSDANRVVQANWNLDTLDGNGPSGATLNLAKTQILVIDLQWLGVGRVRVGFDIDGKIVYAHEFLNANSITTVYMRTANLPIRWSMTGQAIASMDALCASVVSEGGSDTHFSYQFSYNRAVVTAGNGTPVYAFSIRPKATFNSITNRIYINPMEWRCLVTGNNPVLMEIYYGTAVGGTPSWADMNATYSALQVDTAGTPSGGFLVDSLWIPAGTVNRAATVTKATSRYPLVLDIAGTGYNHITVYVTGIGATSTCYPGLTWEEDR